MADVYMDKSNVFAPDATQGESALATAVRRSDHRRASASGKAQDHRVRVLACRATGRESATDLPMRVAFPMLLVNALDWFSGDQADLLTTYRTGSRERVPLDGVVGATEAEVRRAPAGRSPDTTW